MTTADVAATSVSHPLTSDPRLWLLLSPGLPVGGYAYSHGLESAVAAGWVSDPASAKDWIGSIGRRVLCQLDLPILERLYLCAIAADLDGMNYWNSYLLASRETAELQREDTQLGSALQRLMVELGETCAAATLPPKPSFVTSMAVLCQTWAIPVATTCAAYAWIFFDNQVVAATKLVPLGQSTAQRMLLGFAEDIESLVKAAALCNDTDIGFSAPGLAHASCAHETQYSRLFRS